MMAPQGTHISTTVQALSQWRQQFQQWRRKVERSQYHSWQPLCPRRRQFPCDNGVYVVQYRWLRKHFIFDMQNSLMINKRNTIQKRFIRYHIFISPISEICPYFNKDFRNGRIMSLCSSYLMSITGEISLAVNQKAGEILLRMIWVNVIKGEMCPTIS